MTHARFVKTSNSTNEGEASTGLGRARREALGFAHKHVEGSQDRIRMRTREGMKGRDGEGPIALYGCICAAPANIWRRPGPLAVRGIQPGRASAGLCRIAPLTATSHRTTLAGCLRPRRS